MTCRHDVTDAGWALIAPLLLNKRRGVPRVDDRRVISGISKTRHRGLAWVDWQLTLALAAYDLIRLPKLLRAAA